jgi:alanyl-tRNA synthetase
MKSSDIRQQFLTFFESKGHQIVDSSSLVPWDDPTLLFTNAGMNQFKDVFLGFDKRAYNRATTSQKCVRAGGKHNDLENVGYTARHHTFFEMLGNFSFGDYFKREALQYAWELLTEVYKLPKEKLWVTVYAEDDEAFNIWANEIGVPKERIVRIGDNKGGRYASDNFWMMGDTGPCGPCSEIFFDHGPDVAGGPPGSPNEDGDRYIEIWNNVFMQFNRDEAGVMHPLPKPSVDTGMGLERITAVLQHVHSNYEIDLFQHLIKGAARLTGCTDLANPSLRVIADHIRACAFLVADGVIPSSDGRGYVLRRIIRRALRHGHKLGQPKPFFSLLVDDLAQVMGAAYPQLITGGDKIAAVLLQEETRFGETLEHGMAILDAALSSDAKVLNGETAFKLYDTFGFPLDLTADVCRERSVSVDEAGFQAAMEKQRQQARAAGKFKAGAVLDYSGAATQFKGYDTLVVERSKVLALYLDGSLVGQLLAGQGGVVVLDTTPFYAESGGQVGDRGELVAGTGQFEVLDTLKIQADVFGHHGKVLQGQLALGDSVGAQVNTELRTSTIRNHSATHLMHKALREVLGDHVQQKGSLVDAEKTRFDFSHHSPMTDAQISQVESLVNAEVLANAATQAQVMAFDEAVKGGAMALFGEKYGDSVRVLDIGTSRELCGGVHVARTGDVGLFKITAEGGVAAGIRRVEAVTGQNAISHVNGLGQTLAKAAGLLKVPGHELPQKLDQLIEHNKALEKELTKLKSKMAAGQGDDLVSQALDVGGIKVVAALLEGADVKALRDTLDKLKDKLKTAAIVLASCEPGKVTMIAGVTADATGKIKAGELVNFVALQVGGKGGGRADMAQAGGTNDQALPAALASVADWVKKHI